MRTIKFRGLHKTTKTWCYGSLDLTDESGPRIRTSDIELSWSSRFVIPETVGQYTGLKDKNGKDIYAGDVLQDSDTRYLVKWSQKRFGFTIIGTPKGFSHQQALSYSDQMKEIEIIGNITENPELLK